MATKKDISKPTDKSASFTDAERAAMKARAREQKLEARWNKKRAEGEQAALAVIAEMEEPDRAMATRIYALIEAHAPTLFPRTWYGMPAWADREGKVVCFFQGAQKFKTRYATFGFTDRAHLDEGDMWATAFAIKALTPVVEERLIALVQKAVG